MSRRKNPDYQLNPREWASLDDAFARIKASVSSTYVALYDLTRDLREGRLGSATRAISYDGSKSVCAILKPPFWRDLSLDDVVNVRPDGTIEHTNRVRVWPPRGRRFTGRRVFFVRRRDLDKVYPIATPSDRRATMKFVPQPPPKPATKKPAPPRGPKPGSAAAWIEELYPADEWRLMTGKQIHQDIDREAKKRKLNRSPSYRTVLYALRLKRQRRGGATQKTQKSQLRY
jgi:hypothetical protein